MKYFDIEHAKKIYKQGKNVTNYLKKKLNKNYNTPEIIEIAYDLQAGAYINFANRNIEWIKLYTKELASVLDNQINNGDTLLDIGTGELTIFSHLLNALKKKPSNVVAFDLSWSRLEKGKKYFFKNIKNKKTKLLTFCADIQFIPLRSKSIDVIISNHALEPNGKNLLNLLKELFRVAKKKIVLFEPSYELNSKKGKKRMTKLGYIKNISSHVKKAGGTLINFIPLVNNRNSLNPTACYVILPPKTSIKKSDEIILTSPGSNFILKKDKGFYFCKERGLAYPIFKKIPILKNTSSIIATANF